MNSRDAALENYNYYNDPRVHAANKSKWYEELDEKTMTASVSIYSPCEAVAKLDPNYVPDHDMEYALVSVPIKFEVCRTCGGKGKHVNPSIDSSGITGEDFDRDPDFAESYKRGDYDVRCYGCGGLRVTLVLDRENCDPAVLKALDEAAREDAAYEATCRMEQMC